MKEVGTSWLKKMAQFILDNPQFVTGPAKTGHVGT